MIDTIEDLQRKMDAVASALDFEEARRLRDRINLIRGGASAAEVARADTSGLVRQQSGAMGSRHEPATTDIPARVEAAGKTRSDDIRPKAKVRVASTSMRVRVWPELSDAIRAMAQAEANS